MSYEPRVRSQLTSYESRVMTSQEPVNESRVMRHESTCHDESGASKCIYESRVRSQNESLDMSQRTMTSQEPVNAYESGVRIRTSHELLVMIHE